jgi:starvation-inducible DNA-binding protein
MAGFEQIAENASANNMVAHLSKHNRKLVANLIKARDLAGKNGDNETEDLMIARIQIHEKHIWMLDSFLSE